MSRTHTRVTRAALLCAAAAAGAFLLPAAGSAAAPVWSAAVYDVVPSDATDPYPDFVSFERTGGDALPAGTRLALIIERAGETLATGSTKSIDYATASTPDLRTGDLARLTDRTTGAELARVAVDGRPSLGDTTCIGQRQFDGLRTPGASVTDVTAFQWGRNDERGEYGAAFTWWERTEFNPGATARSVGDGFTGSFGRPLAAGTILAATSSHKVSSTLTVTRTVERAVTACPGAGAGAGAGGERKPQPGPVPVDRAAPQATYVAPSAKTLKRFTLRALRAPGLEFAVTSSEVGKVVASLRYRRGKKKKSVLIKTITVPVKAGAPATVNLRLPNSARRKLKRVPKGSTLIASLTVTDAAGNVTTLKPLRFAVPKK